MASNDDRTVEADDAGVAFDDVADHYREGCARDRWDCRMGDADEVLDCTFHDGDDIQKDLAAEAHLCMEKQLLHGDDDVGLDSGHNFHF
mmetsp:Transcript_16185/g.34981  ORF Transcript_16185/g.34981 Transcript_16185/m.34981 type:complete len:89 (-) Transcript_16185:2661-2927(-)